MFLHVPVYALSRALSFPSPDQAVEGLVAVGGDLSPERLLLAYRSGIFPWYDDGLPILWHSPDPRCVIPLDCLHVGRTLRRTMARGDVRGALRHSVRTGHPRVQEEPAPRPGRHVDHR